MSKTNEEFNDLQKVFYFIARAISKNRFDLVISKLKEYNIDPICNNNFFFKTAFNLEVIDTAIQLSCIEEVQETSSFGFEFKNFIATQYSENKSEKLIQAVKDNDFSLVTELLQDPKVNINHECGKILFYAFKNKNKDISNLLLKQKNISPNFKIQELLELLFQWDDKEIINLYINHHNFYCYSYSQNLILSTWENNRENIFYLYKIPSYKTAIQKHAPMIKEYIEVNNKIKYF